MTRAIIMAAAVAMAGCAAHEPPRAVERPPPQVSPAKLNAKQITAAQQAVRAKLKDPESARFRKQVTGADPTGILYACGMVNAKNSYGGYTGEKPYMVILLPHVSETTIGSINIGDLPGAVVGH